MRSPARLEKPTTASGVVQRSDLGRVIVWFCPAGLFATSLALRIAWLQGAILGDDPLEFGFIDAVAQSGTDFRGELPYRFPIWILNVITIRLFGLSEASFFAPTWLCSASFSALGYGIARAWGIARPPAALIGLFVATAPFEVVLGTLRANDLFLAWCLALGLWALVRLESRPAWQGAAVGLCLWLAFYAKLWAVYSVPALTLYFMARGARERTWRGLGAWIGTSAALHGATALFWKVRTGVWLPFLVWYPAPYPVRLGDELWYVFKRYPRMLFQGAEFGTTLFGYVPYALLALLAFAVVRRMAGRRADGTPSLDRWDGFLALYWGSWFTLLNFAPTGYRFDQYYAPPHIFRYLAPISFPITLHVGKLAWQLGGNRRQVGRAIAGGFLTLLIGVNLVQAEEAVRLGRTNRRALTAVVEDLKRFEPPQVLTDSWLAIFLRRMYLGKTGIAGAVVAPDGIYKTPQFEQWVRALEPTLPTDSMLITGLGQCVHYQCRDCGLRLRNFARPLGETWVLVGEYGVQDYLPRPEPARLWRYLGPRLERGNAPREDDMPAPSLPADALFAEGLRHFDRGEYSLAGLVFRQVRRAFPDPRQAADAQYFLGACALRRADWQQAIRESRQLLREFPQSPWVGTAHYNLGLAYRALDRREEAEAAFEQALDVLPPHHYLRKHAALMLGELRRQDGSLVNAWKTLLDKWKTIRRHLIDAATATTAVTVSLRAGSRLDFGQRGVTVA